MDVIYGLRAQQTKLFPSPPTTPPPAHDHRAPLGQLFANPRIWKTFASPETLYRLYVLPSGLIRVLRPEESPDPSWPEIPPISAENLLRIAKEFIAELPDSQQSILLNTLTQPRWWFPYFELLSTLGLKFRWISFRRRRIAEEFERAVAAYAPPPIAPTDEKPRADEPAQKSEPQQSLRHIAASAIQRMTDVELRALNLPLGYVIDALTSK